MARDNQSDDRIKKDHTCAGCGEWKIVPSLARDCELRHAKEAAK